MFKEVGLTGIIDIAFMSFLIYLLLVWFKKTRAAAVFMGIIIFAAVYVIAEYFDLVLTAGMFQLFFAVILLALVIIFQEEIRRFFEQVAMWGFRRRFRQKRAQILLREEVEILARTLFDLAHDKIGALIVVRGVNLIASHLVGGVELDGKLSEPMLKSLFDPHSIGHDGALVIEGDRIVRFGAHLPLSKNLKKLQYGGTRHAAALGISELTDALALVVSEERGTISSVRHGVVREVHDAAGLAHAIDRFYNDTAPGKDKFSVKNLVVRNYREKLIAIGLAILLWVVQVYGTKVMYRTFAIPVEYAEPESGLAITEIVPSRVSVTFSAPRRILYSVGKAKIKLFLKTLDIQPGTRALTIIPSDLSFPKTLKLEEIEPQRVRVKVIKEEAEEPSDTTKKN